MLTIQEIILIFVLIALLGGWAMGRIGAWMGARGAGASEDAHHRIRALEADLRVAQRKAEEAELVIERNREETEGLQAQAKADAEAIAERDRDLLQLQKRLSDECNKTNNLRLELTNRAEETIRASVRVKEAETELSVARAGSDAVLDQIRQLAAEREELTGRLKTLQAEAAGRPSKVTRLPLREPPER